MSRLKKLFLRRLFPFSVCFVLIGLPLLAWGDEGHYWVTRHALKALPPDIRNELSTRERDLIDFSILADLRKADDPDEAPKHYLNLDAYGDYPFPDFTLRRDVLEKRWGEEIVRRNGTLPWTIASAYDQLVDAFARRDTGATLRLAADLSHYVADLHQPFHSARNYNGQLSNQHGIHFRFESDLFQRFQKQIIYRPPRRLERFDTIGGHTLVWLKESFTLVEPILEADASIVAELKFDRGSYYEDGRRLPYPDEYYRRLWLETGNLMEQQLNHAVWAVASLWWMAWQEGSH